MTAGSDGSATPELFDPYRAAEQRDPHPIYRLLRDEHPLYRNHVRDFWALSRHADVRAALHDHQTFSSAGSLAVGGVDVTELLPMLIMMDPPRHDRLRALVSRAFTPRRVAAMEVRVTAVARRLARNLAARLDDGGAGDLVVDFAGPLPIEVMTELLGIDGGDSGDFRRWTEQFVQGDPASEELSRTALAGAGALYELLGAIVEHRRTTPGPDLITALIAATVDGERLTDDELLGFCFLLLVAGTETTTNLLANGVTALAAHPDSRRRLADDPTLLPAAVEEMVRFDGPVQGLARRTQRDVELHGATIPAGHQVLLLFAAANRDERAFHRPDDFDVQRRPDGHLGFGHGIHHCLGAALARLEARVALHELLTCLPAIDVDPAAGERLTSSFLRGFRRLPVVGGGPA